MFMARIAAIILLLVSVLRMILKTVDKCLERGEDALTRFYGNKF